MGTIHIDKNRQNNYVDVVTAFDEIVVPTGGSVVSDPMSIGNVVGFFTIQESISGDGTLKLEYLVSLDGTNFLTPSEASEIATGQTKTSGPGSGGKDVISFEPVLAPWIKIKATETGSSNDATLTLHLAVQ